MLKKTAIFLGAVILGSGLAQCSDGIFEFSEDEGGEKLRLFPFSLGSDGEGSSGEGEAKDPVVAPTKAVLSEFEKGRHAQQEKQASEGEIVVGRPSGLPQRTPPTNHPDSAPYSCP